ncbi:hypothetical protein BHE90_012944 [Fusarium euwallaceae]|uniref:Uncharacterized protein n=2 Tax=Fusarium solani species complex TaxID=232080 RepID=A0A430LAE9_9HYPO|nr:hypothetical protein CEP51_006011 [Fusarium floridanum]RTE72635.1 hypothetical protein BHE90_012944 [Fusarium euwallaceae]
MPRLLSSGGNRRRESRPRAQRPRRQWVLRREYVLVRRRRPQSSRRRPQAPRVRLPHRRSPSPPTVDASPTDIPVEAQESGTPESPTIIPDDPTTVTDEPRSPRAYFITIMRHRPGPYNVRVERQGVAASADRLLRSQCEDSAFWDSETQSVSFAVIGDDPTEAVKRAITRFIGEAVQMDIVVEENMERLRLQGRGPGLQVL